MGTTEIPEPDYPDTNFNSIFLLTKNLQDMKNNEQRSSGLKRLAMATLVLLLCVPIFAQSQVQVTGRVIDNLGEPMIGVSILEKGTTNGVVTDLDGNYSLNAQDGGTLVFSYVGYVTQEHPVAAGTLNVTLAEDSETLDELVVVGYGVQKKSNVTGAISKVDAEAMQNRTITSAQDALGGKTSGVQLISTSGAPGDVATIRIRGYSSNYSSDPLYIVDGLKVSDISNIDANDIESIEVLKDAASAAIYGAEAGNGVILVTTKRASTGKTTVTYDFQLSLNTLKKADTMNAREYITYWKEAGNLTDEMLAASYDGVTDNNWQESATETSMMQKHSLSLQSGSEKGQVFLSLNYLNNDGFMKGDIDRHQRYNFTVNAELKMKPWLTVGTNTRISYNKVSTKPYFALDGFATGPVTSMLLLDPLTPTVYNANNLPATMQAAIAEGRPVPQDENGNYYGASQFITSTSTQNPLFYQRNTNYSNERTYINGMLYANITPFEGFVFTSRLGMNFYHNFTNQYSKAYYINDLQYSNQPSVNSSSPSTLYYQWENFANYTKDINGHTLGAMLGMSYSETMSNTLSGSADNIIKWQDNYGYLDFATADAKYTVGGQKVKTAKLSYFGRVNYNYKDRYMAEFTMRADAADLSVLSEQERWGYFPAVSVGWNITNEEFFPQNDILSAAKIRVSWGQNGSISNLGNYMYLSAITSDVSYPFGLDGTLSTGSYPSSVGNNGLKWETTEQLDFGVDLRFFQNRLSLTADYYIKRTKDLLVTGSKPSLTAGTNASPINAGDIENRGLDLDLTWRDQHGDFSYSVNANIATLKNKVTYLDDTILRIAGSNASGGNPFTYFEEGYPLWYMRGYQVDHIDENGNAVFKDIDGVEGITGNDVTMIGSGIPKFTYGITLNMAYKGFDLTVFGSGSYGNDIFYNLNATNDGMVNKLGYFYDNRWTPENTSAKFASPAFQNGTQKREYSMSDAYLFDGSYFKIKQIQLGYTFPKSWMNAIGLQNIRAYVSMDDFITFTKYPGLDPETASRSVTTGIGIDSGSYPSSKKVVFGVNLTF